MGGGDSGCMADLGLIMNHISGESADSGLWVLVQGNARQLKTLNNT